MKKLFAAKSLQACGTETPCILQSAQSFENQFRELEKMEADVCEFDSVRLKQSDLV